MNEGANIIQGRNNNQVVLDKTGGIMVNSGNSTILVNVEQKTPLQSQIPSTITSNFVMTNSTGSTNNITGSADIIPLYYPTESKISTLPTRSLIDTSSIFLPEEEDLQYISLYDPTLSVITIYKDQIILKKSSTSEIPTGNLNSNDITALAEHEIKAWGIDLNLITKTPNLYIVGLNESNPRVLNNLERYVNTTPGLAASGYANGSYAWSAIYISHIMKQADSTFIVNQRHDGYFNPGLQSNPPNGYKQFNIIDELQSNKPVKLQVGDLLSYPANSTSLDPYPHSDLIYKIEGDYVFITGGNIQDSAVVWVLKIPNATLTLSNNPKGVLSYNRNYQNGFPTNDGTFLYYDRLLRKIN